MSSRLQKTTLIGSVAAATLASICCIGPLVFAILGISGAGFTLRFEEYRPLFIVLAVGLLAVAFYLGYRKKPANECAEGTYCAHPTSERVNRIVLWAATVLVVFFIFFPGISSRLLD